METIAYKTDRKEITFFLKTYYTANRDFFFIFIFLSFSVITLIFNVAEGEMWYGVLFTVVLAILFFVLLRINANHRSFYTINGHELILKMGNTRRVIKISDIKEVRIILEEEARGELNKYHLEEMTLRHSFNTVEYFRAQRRLGKFTAYFTVPIIYNKEGNQLVSQVGQKLNDQFVLLQAASGTRLLLSPRKPEEFIKSIRLS